jgi:ribosomal protein L21
MTHYLFRTSPHLNTWVLLPQARPATALTCLSKTFHAEASSQQQQAATTIVLVATTKLPNIIIPTKFPQSLPCIVNKRINKMATQRTASALKYMQQRYANSTICSNYGRTLTTTATTKATTNKSTATAGIGIGIAKHQTIFHRSLAYASVKHDVEYKNQMEGRHGEQLQLAFEEGMKYEHEAVDPFELYKIDPEDALDEEGDYDDDEDVISDDNMELEEDDEDEEDDASTEYTHDGHPKRSKAELVSLRAGAPAGGKFAIVNLDGSQQKVAIDDVVIVNKLKPVEKWTVGTTHTLNANDGQVLLLGSQEKTLVGLPYVNGGEVDVMVEEITRDKKVIIFKKKRRKNYRRKNGFKREVTFLRILDIRFP